MPRKFKGLNSFQLKCIAMITMLLDHIGTVFVYNSNVLNMIGRIAFPIFAFFVAEGMRHTKSRPKYLGRMLLFAIVSELPFDLAFGEGLFHQNVIFTFALAIIAISVTDWLIEKIPKTAGFVVGAAFCAIIYIVAQFTMVDYIGYGVVTVLIFYYCHSDSYRFITNAIAAAAVCWINWEGFGGLLIDGPFGFMIPLQGFAILALPLIWCYNGERGYTNKYVKYLFYGFYPLHLILIAIVFRSLYY